MRDAIYGIYEDTDPNSTLGFGSTAGIYKSVSPMSDCPCQHVTVSWWNMAQYHCNSLKETYQIVLYEGTNVYRIHFSRKIHPKAVQTRVGSVTLIR